MRLLIMVFCLLSERYLIHTLANYRFYCFAKYYTQFANKINTKFNVKPFLLLIIIVLTPLVPLAIMLYLLEDVWFSFPNFLINLIIFYFCIGPQNPFYPIRSASVNSEDETNIVGNFLASINEALFAVMFWFSVAGPLGALCYRLVALCARQSITAEQGKRILAILDWIPVRITLLLYLLVGNFQAGINFFSQMLFVTPNKNYTILSQGGLLAVRTSNNEQVNFAVAETIVEHALLLYLVIIAVIMLM